MTVTGGESRIEDALVFAHLTEASCTMAELSRQRWFVGRERACRLAMERLRESGQIRVDNGWWHVVSGEPREPSRDTQKMLF